MWEGAWCGGVVVLDKSVLWLEVASYVWPNVRSEWLQVVSGRVLCGGSMCICGSVCEGVTQSTIVHTLMCWLVSWEAGMQAVCTV